MAPSNPLLSATDGRSGENRRRRGSGYPSSAIAAAEAAASYILSDGPISNKKSVRNRSSSSSNVNVNANNVNNNGGSSHNVNNINSGNVPRSFLMRMQRQRETLMQRQRREKNFTFKIKAWIFVFFLGVVLLQQQRRGQQNPGHESEATPSIEKGGRNNNGDESTKVSVPLPPNVERKHEKDKFVASFVRGAHYNNNKHNHNNNNAPQKEATESEPDPKAKGVSIADEAHTMQKETEAENVRAIPPVLIFTYHTNLITTPESDLTDEEDVALSKNVQSIISLHPGSTIRFLNDEDCLNSIRVALGPDTNLTSYFANEKHGMYKADICRGAALYETGGMYFDIDIEARMSLWDVIAPKTKFVTTFVHKDSNHYGGFFQAFIGVTPKHAIMKRYLELFVLYYEGELTVDGPLGVYFLRMAYDAIIGENPDKEPIDLWREVRYSPELFPDVKRKWGKRRACQMLVVAPAKNTDGFERKQMVPLFSHANGSRMCGGKDTNQAKG